MTTETVAETEVEKTPAETGASLNTRGIDPDLRYRFKAWCAGKRTNMTQAIIALMKLAMDEDLNLDTPPIRG